MITVGYKEYDYEREFRMDYFVAVRGSLGLDVLLQNAATQDLPRMRPTVFANSIAVHQNETYVVGRGYLCSNCGCEVDMDGQKVPAGTAPRQQAVTRGIEIMAIIGLPTLIILSIALQHIIVASEPASPKFVKAALSNSDNGTGN